MIMESYKKGWAFVLTLAMVFTTLFGGFGFLGVKGMVGEVYAATDEWSGGTINSITVTDGAIINVSGTVTLTGIITISGSAIITGSGIIQAKSDFSPARMIDVPAGSTLTISGVTMDANNRNTRGIEVAGTLNMEGSSKILNCAAGGSFGGTAYAVNINGTGEFNMHDSAEIRGCKHGGVYMNGSADFNMNDTAIITDCEVGVGVWVNHTTGSFHMANNAIISDCHSGDGGGVFSYGTVIMSEYAEISNCTANFRGGGGLCIDAGTFSMQDNAKISSCSSISTGAYHGGGGIRIGSAIFNMSGGTIENCESATYGGGMYINNSTLNLSGGIIQNCEAPAGGGIAIGSFNPDAINVSGSTKIVNNTISGTTPSNIQLKTGTYIQIAGSGLTAGASLGITPATLPTGSVNVNVVTSTALHTVSAADAAYFHADSSAHFITYSSIVADNALLLVANEWTPPVKNSTPTAIFNASNMTLSNLTTSMQYSEDGGGSWNWVAASSISMSGVTTTNGIKVKEPGDGGLNTLDSDIQTISLTQAASVSAGDFTVSQPATVGGAGTIGGITVAMQYSTNGGSSWTNGNGSNLGNLAGGTTVQIRNKGIGTTLAGVTYSIAITTFSGTSESTPNAVVNYFGEKLTGLSADAIYMINGTEYTADGSGNITIAAVWYGTNPSIVKKGNSITTTDSTAQSVALANRPGTPVAGQFAVTHPAISGGIGTISGITTAMEYSTNSGVSWTPGSGSNVTEIDGTIVTIRVKATGTTPVSLSYNITLTPVTYALTISGGGIGATANGSYASGALSINAGTVAGYNFNGWTSSGGGIFANASLASTTYTMPANAATITANWTISSGDGGSGSGSGNGGGSNITKATSVINTNTGSVTGNQLSNAAAAAKDGETVTIKSNETDQVTLPASGLDSLSDRNNSLTVVTEKGTLIFNSKAVDAMGTQATDDDIKVIVDDVVKTALTEAQQTEVGDKTVYDLTVMSGGKLISNFNGGKVTVSIPYDLKSGETAEDLKVWYMADNGSLTEINCTYDTKTKAVTFVVEHFSKYLIGFDEVTGWVNPFTDVKSSAWYYDAAVFVNTNGLMKGQTDTTFAPQTAMTRGMFVTILGRMEGIDATAYASKSTFSDVKSNEYYAPYIAWATEKGIVSGMSADKFAPSAAVTREQMAVMMTNYMKAIGEGPTGEWAIQLTYSDLDQVSSWADEAVMFMTMKGLMNGTGNDAAGNPLFAPKSTSTRAQTAQVMMSLGELLN